MHEWDGLFAYSRGGRAEESRDLLALSRGNPAEVVWREQLPLGYATSRPSSEINSEVWVVLGAHFEGVRTNAACLSGLGSSIVLG